MSDWYYADNNEQRGPVLESELKGLLASSKLPGDTLVWKEGMANWSPASTVAPLTSAPASTVVTSVASTPNPASITPVGMSDIIGTPEALEVDSDDAEKNKIFGVIAYLNILCLVPLLAMKDSPFAQYHAKQGLTLFIVTVGLWFIKAILAILFNFVMPGGSFLLEFVWAVVLFGILILTIIGIINAAKGKCVPLPLIGGIKIFNK